jgi:hypothetical protein
VGKTTSTHFAKQKLEQKKNSLHAKNFKIKRLEKKPFKLAQEKNSSA